MTRGIETLDVVEPWLIAVLKDALIDSVQPTLVNAVINAQTTENVVTPYAVVSQVSSRDIRGIGVIRIDTDSIYSVKVIHRSNSFVPGRAAMRAVETAIGGVTATTEYGYVTCVRESSFHFPETIDGVQYTHVGANYRLRAASN